MATTITYGGNTIASLSSGETFTSSGLANKVASTNIVVTANGASGEKTTVTYNGNTLFDQQSGTFTMPTAGKIVPYEFAVEYSGTPTPSTDLTGTTWQIKNSYTELDCPWRGDTYNINFTSNGNNYIRLQFINYEIRYNTTTVFAPASGPPSWVNQAYRTIAITGGADTGSTALREWLEANATQIV